ncbi:MAG TPA: HIT domain-containing protein [Patescibacteria group bacterium]|nr:HIT domain-containing protein [Patescibacteria group bacterium]
MAISNEFVAEEPKPCLFCELGKRPENVIWENDFFYAQLDKFPVSPGHAEVIPKNHIVSLLDLNPEDWTFLQEAIVETVRVIETLDFREIYSNFLQNPINDKSAWFCRRMLEHPGVGRKPDGYNFGNNDGAAAGRTIHHLHIHIIPRFMGDTENPEGGIRHIIPGMGKYK